MLKTLNFSLKQELMADKAFFWWQEFNCGKELIAQYNKCFSEEIWSKAKWEKAQPSEEQKRENEQQEISGEWYLPDEVYQHFTALLKGKDVLTGSGLQDDKENPYAKPGTTINETGEVVRKW